MTACTFTGGPECLGEKLSVFIAETGIDELMITSPVYDPEAKLTSHVDCDNVEPREDADGIIF